MRLKLSAAAFFAAAMLTGCSSGGNQLTSGGQNVRFVDEQPSSQCRFIANLTGEQSNWLSGQNLEGVAQCVVRQMTCVTRRLQWAGTSFMVPALRDCQ